MLNKAVITLLLFFSMVLVLPAQKGEPNTSISADQYIQLVDSLSALKNFESAAQYMEQALLAYPANAEVYTTAAYLLVELGEYQVAHSYFTEAIRLDSTNSDRWYNRGYFLYTANATEASIYDYEKAVTYAENDTVKYGIYLNLAAQYSAIREFERSYALIKEAHDWDPENTDFLNNLALVCDEVGREDETLGYLYRIIELDSTHEEAITNIGFILQENGQFEESLPYFDRAIEINPRAGIIFSNKSTSLLGLGRLEEAMTNITRSLELLPGNSWAYKTKARIHLARGENEMACQSLDVAVQLGYTRQYGNAVEELQREHCLTEKH
ncbi:MAG: tetratricopeptide repeat protein [Bacteroidota bacterium]